MCELTRLTNLLHIVVKLSKSHNNDDTLDIKIKHEICIGGKDNYIQRISNFKFQHKLHLLIVRKNGLIQLYKKQESKHQGTFYQLSKEWKNSILNQQDSIISLGFLNNQYLYSCSRDGKLVIRDLINDDADEGYKVYLIQSPVSNIDINMNNTNGITIVSCGKNNEVKLYEIENLVGYSPPPSNTSSSSSPRFSSLHDDSTAELTFGTIMRNRPLRRSYANLNLRFDYSTQPNSDRHVMTLSPSWSSSTHFLDFIYNAQSLEKISNWYISIVIVGGGYIVCGSQFGKLSLYNAVEDCYAIKTITLSQFPILNLKELDNDHILYSDSMCKIGIVKLSTMQVINHYDNLRIGPINHFQFILPGNLTKKRKISGDRLRFDPIYTMSTTIDKRFVIYKLYDDNRFELLLDVKLFDSLVPCISLLKKNSKTDYEIFQSLFGGQEEEDQYEGFHNPERIFTKKRKLSQDSPILLPSPPHSQHSSSDDTKKLKSGEELYAHFQHMTNLPFSPFSTVDPTVTTATPPPIAIHDRPAEYDDSQDVVHDLDDYECDDDDKETFK